MNSFCKYFLLIVANCLFAQWAYADADEEVVAPVGHESGGYELIGIVENGDTIPFELLSPVTVSVPITSTDFWQVVKRVKKTYPIAQEVAVEVKKVDAITKNMSKKERKKYIKEHEEELTEKYKPVLMKMSRTNGKILIQLVDRQCDQSCYELVQMFAGKFRAFFYQGIAKVFGHDLKKEYKENKAIENAINYLAQTNQIQLAEDDPIYRRGVPN